MGFFMKCPPVISFRPLAGKRWSKRMFGKSKGLLKTSLVNLSPSKRESLKPPFSCREGGIGGLGLGGFNVNKHTFQTSSKTLHKGSFFGRPHVFCFRPLAGKRWSKTFLKLPSVPHRYKNVSVPLRGKSGLRPV